MQLVQENRIPEFDNLYLGTCSPRPALTQT